MDQQFLNLSKVLLNQYRLVLAATFYSWAAGMVWERFFLPFDALKSETAGERAGEGTRAFLVTNEGEEKLGAKSAGSLMFLSPEHHLYWTQRF